MNTATQIIKRLLESPDLNLESLDPETVTAILEARACLVMEEEVHEARAQVKVNNLGGALRRLKVLRNKYGDTDSILAGLTYVDNVAKAMPENKDLATMARLKQLITEALDLASQDNQDFMRSGGAERVMEIAKEVSQL